MKRNRIGNKNEILDSIRIGEEEDKIREEINSSDISVGLSKGEHRSVHRSHFKSHEKLDQIQLNGNNKKRIQNTDLTNDSMDNSKLVNRLDKNENEIVQKDHTKEHLKGNKINHPHSRVNRRRKSNTKLRSQNDQTKHSKNRTHPSETESKTNDHKIQLFQIQKLTTPKADQSIKVKSNDQKGNPNNQTKSKASTNLAIGSKNQLKVNESVIRMQSSNENLNESSSDEKKVGAFSKELRQKVRIESETSEDDYLHEYFNQNDEESKLNSLPRKTNKTKSSIKSHSKSSATDEDLTKKLNDRLNLSSDSENSDEERGFEFQISDDEFKEGNLFYPSSYKNKEEYEIERKKMYETNKNKDYLKHGLKRSSITPTCTSNSKGGILQVFVVVVIAVIVMKILVPKSSKHSLIN